MDLLPPEFSLRLEFSKSESSGTAKINQTPFSQRAKIVIKRVFFVFPPKIAPSPTLLLSPRDNVSHIKSYHCVVVSLLRMVLPSASGRRPRGREKPHYTDDHLMTISHAETTRLWRRLLMGQTDQMGPTCLTMPRRPPGGCKKETRSRGEGSGLDLVKYML